MKVMQKSKLVPFFRAKNLLRTKDLFLGFAIILFGCSVCIACSGAAGNSSNKDSGAGPVAAVADPSAGGGSGNASFSCKLDGVDFSSNKGTDNLNAGFRLAAGEKHIFFMLCDPDNPVQKLNFETPGQVGSTTLTITPKYAYGGYSNKDWVSYNDDGLTITISSISATRISGTFSGKYKAPEGFPNAKPEVEVTDGKFDIPFSTSAQWKKTYQAE
jgi:hypothetical protein